ncbi:MAG: DUF262 domain-containing HNH endonuclease family protein [Candidatus Accumulibacter sp.]|jgi:hypothetical protein|nr:DUF262 domain-containing HNH endonuclease family protein [Accumulibacter sp.]
MAATNFKTENNTFRKLIGNGLTYRIPRFQRDYSWTSEEWEDLWMDIGALGPDREAAHYMGYLVLQSPDDKNFDVIDGQQRMTTISLIVLAVLKNLRRLVDSGVDADANTRRIDQIMQTYVGYLDPVTLVARPKLTLNRNNNDYFQNHLVPLTQLPQRGLRASERLLRNAFEWFDKQVSDYLKSSGNGDDGRRLAQLVEDISDRLFFTVITVTDELNAYKVFETLNARGVRLSATDLLKNHLFSVLDQGGETDHELRNLEDRWESIVGRLQAEKFTDFLRVHWNSRHTFARQADLFKTIRSRVSTRESVFQLLRNMEEDLDTYLSLSSPETSEWPENDKHLAGTLKTFRVKQPFPLLLAAKRVFNAEDFTGLLRSAVVISMRYNVICTYSTGEQERTYNAVAERIARKELTTLAPVLTAMRSIYPNDRSFRAAFGEKVIRTKDSRNNQVVRFILCALERHLFHRDLDFHSGAISVEHILPQNAPDDWGGFSSDEADTLVYRIGNMTLLQARANRELGVYAYPDKRPSYQQSDFGITRKLAEENTEWTPERIASRQAWMAAQAASIWRIPQLD